MSRKNFYSVAKGIKTGIFTEWSECDANVTRVPHAIFKGFKEIDEAVIFLIAGTTYNSCKTIPIYDGSSVVKYPKDYGHICKNDPCTPDSIETYEAIEGGAISENRNDTCSSLDDTFIEAPSDIINNSSENTYQKIIIESVQEGEQQNTDKSEAPILKDETYGAEMNEKAQSPEQNTEENNNIIVCTQKCDQPVNKHMILCNKCKSWTHFSCTKLPVYQLYILTSTSRRYTCEICTIVPQNFKEGWVTTGSSINHKQQDKNTDVQANTDSKTIEIISRFEKCLVDTLTDVHKSGKDELILQLQSELEQKNKCNSQLKQMETNIIESISTSQNQEKDNLINKLQKDITEQKANASRFDEIELKLNSLNGDINKLSQVNQELTDKLRTSISFTENVVKEVHTTCEAVSKSNDNQVNISSKLERITRNIRPETIRDKPNSTQTSENNRNGPIRSSIEISNRYEPLMSVNQDNIHEIPNGRDKSEDTASKKVMIIGNSHINYIKTEKFIPNCHVKKFSARSCEEVESKIGEIDEDCDLIVLHMFSNDVRNFEPENCIKAHTQLIRMLQTQCQFAEIVLSLPFYTFKDSNIYAKLEKCIILVKYQYHSNPTVHICDNSSLSSFGSPIKRLFARDGLHLSPEGLNVFVTNIKFAIRRALKLEMPQRRRQQPNFSPGPDQQSSPTCMFPLQPGFMFQYPQNMSNMQQPYPNMSNTQQPFFTNTGMSNMQQPCFSNTGMPNMQQQSFRPRFGKQSFQPNGYGSPQNMYDSYRRT